jgi:hypothetical protein
MSQEQVEIVREHSEAVRSGDFQHALSFFDPHVVVDMARIGGPEEDAAFGPEGVADYMRRYAGPNARAIRKWHQGPRRRPRRGSEHAIRFGFPFACARWSPTSPSEP